MYYVYILSNRWHSVFYTGFTNDIQRRIFEHKTKVFKDAFTRRFNVDRLMYYEMRDTYKDAIAREQEVKHLRREYKMQLIRRMNPGMVDLSIRWSM
ncbi:MAG: GIY-YIG nuclease family protein [Bacteroidota bacterium]